MTDKRYSSVRDYVSGPNLKKQKTCGNCGSFATKEVFFVAEGDISVVERYCEMCSHAVVKESKNARYL
jgi:MinD superfamily P-loop ATPase